MLLNRGLIAVAVSVAIPICFATEKLTRDGLSAFEFPNYEGAVNISTNQDAVQYPGSKIGAMSNAMSNQKHLMLLAKVKRTLLGGRQFCNLGYYYCPGYGCTILDNTCCLANHVCFSGYQCCGSGCAPLSSECCVGGTYCNAGLHCYLVKGVQKCCTNSNCDDSAASSSAIPNVSATSVSPKLTIQSTSPPSVSTSVAAKSSSVIATPTALASSPSPSSSSKSSLSPTPSPTPGSSSTRSSTSPLTSTSPAALTTSRSTTSSHSTTAVKTFAGSAVISGPTERAWAMGLTAVAMMLGAGIVIL